MEGLFLPEQAKGRPDDKRPLDSGKGQRGSGKDTRRRQNGVRLRTAAGTVWVAQAKREDARALPLAPAHLMNISARSLVIHELVRASSCEPTAGSAKKGAGGGGSVSAKRESQLQACERVHRQSGDTPADAATRTTADAAAAAPLSSEPSSVTQLELSVLFSSF
ncbi:hypothetical protein EYF80_027072 [Liparis tanakae]|uniref:Uncharacterized protein n=1 Tax=Liparis tanakae TaxID=230148 RepID=A0A4Z2HB29_9TELE|nr:hypothetical protein EYF80_027072 [Liparis tanakae]